MRLDDVHKRFRSLAGFDLQELAGGTLAAEIPVPEALANRLIAERLPTANVPIADLRLRALERDAIEAHVTVKGSRMVPVLKIVAQIERQPQPHDPVLLLRWSMPAMGPLAMFAGPVLSHFRKLPPGIRMEGERIAVDVRELLASRGMADLLEFLTDLQVHTRAGTFLVRVGVRVPSVPPAQAPRPSPL
jgi:hypothetical protein